tara:strand:+ start:8822 stop:10135 length:1314 start_codon:yes stop_codon:yes gene_type:complete
MERSMIWIFLQFFVLSYTYAAPVDIDKTVSLYSTSPNLHAVFENYKQRMANLDKAFLALFPTYKLSGMFGSEYRLQRLTSSSQPTRLKTKNVFMNATETFQFGKDYFNWKAKEYQRINEDINYRNGFEEVIISGVILHIKGFLTQQKLKVIKERSKAIRRNRAQTNIKYRQGLISFTEKNNTIERLDQLEVDDFRIQREWGDILNQYENETGKMVTGFKNIAFQSWDQATPKDEKAFKKLAVINDATIVMAENDHNATKMELSSAESNLYPKIDFSVNSIIERGAAGVAQNTTSENISVTISHDLFASFKDIYDLKIVKSKARVAKVKYLQARRNLRYDLHNQWTQFELSKKSYEMLKRKFERLKGLQKYQEHEFESGRISIKQLLESEEVFAQVESEMIDSLLIYRTQQIAILKLSGQLTNVLGYQLGEVDYDSFK